MLVQVQRSGKPGMAEVAHACSGNFIVSFSPPSPLWPGVGESAACLILVRSVLGGGSVGFCPLLVSSSTKNFFAWLDLEEPERKTEKRGERASEATKCEMTPRVR